MAQHHSTNGSKPAKPFADFPLGWHPSGYWCKRIGGELRYFGPRHGTWHEALEDYQAVAADLHAGRKPRANRGAISMRHAMNAYLTAREQDVGLGELHPRAFKAYVVTCKQLVEFFGPDRAVEDLGPDAFLQLRASYPDTWGPRMVANEVQRTKTVFKWLYDLGAIDRPLRYGSFKRPSDRLLRLDRQAKPPKYFSAEEVHTLLGEAGDTMRAAILLGVNCAFGNTDVGLLSTDALKLRLKSKFDCYRPRSSVKTPENQWVFFHRQKTGIDRRCWLWPETAKALEIAYLNRPKPADRKWEDLLLLTDRGYSWAANQTSLGNAFRVVCERCGCYRKGVGFYALRHVFQTVADETRDPPAVDLIMGHVRTDMASVYREQISGERIEAVCRYVRSWFLEGVQQNA